MTSSQVSQAQAAYGLFLRATSAWPNNVSTSATIGRGQATENFTNIATGYDRTLTINTNGASATLDLDTNNAVGCTSTSGINLADFEGNSLGTVSQLKGLLSRCNAGSATIAGNTANVIDASISNGGKILICNESGLGSALTSQTLTFTATSANTAVQVTILAT
jgi:hypothetical protein